MGDEGVRNREYDLDGDGGNGGTGDDKQSWLGVALVGHAHW